MAKKNWLGDFNPETLYQFKELYDFTSCQRPDGSVYGIGAGKTCRKGKEVQGRGRKFTPEQRKAISERGSKRKKELEDVEAKPKIQKETKSESAKKALASEISRHIKEYSFTMPGRSFDGSDIANMVNEAANLPGEAGQNVAKMQFFILKDKQGLFVGEAMEQYAERLGTLGVREFNKKDVPWAMTPEYKATLEKMGMSDAVKRVSDAESRLERNKAKNQSKKKLRSTRSTELIQKITSALIN